MLKLLKRNKILNLRGLCDPWKFFDEIKFLMQLHIRKDQERNDVRERYIMKAFVETNWHLANIF